MILSDSEAAELIDALNNYREALDVARSTMRNQAGAIDDLLRLVAELRDSVDRRDLRILEVEAALAQAERDRDEMAELACHHEDRLAQQLIDEWGRS